MEAKEDETQGNKWAGGHVAEEYTGGGATHAHAGGGNMAAITSLYGLF